VFGLGVQELILILVIILLLFGGKKLPELSRSIGTAIKDVRKGFTDNTESNEEAKKTKKS